MTESDIEVIMERAKELSSGGQAPDHRRQPAAVYCQKARYGAAEDHAAHRKNRQDTAVRCA
jgi:hypothetical protein